MRAAAILRSLDPDTALRSCALPPLPSWAPTLGATLARAALVSPSDAELELDRSAIAMVRGASTQRRVLQILIAGIVAAALPPWVRAVRAATSVEDRTGVDLVVTCDDGEHAIEVKSSVGGLRQFVADRAAHSDSRPRGVVVVVHEMPDRLVRGQVVAALNTLRLERRMAAEGA